MPGKNDSGRSKVKHTRHGSDIIFTVEGIDRVFRISLASPEQVNIVRPDLNELISAIERVWRKQS